MAEEAAPPLLEELPTPPAPSSSPPSDRIAEAVPSPGGPPPWDPGAIEARKAEARASKDWVGLAHLLEAEAVQAAPPSTRVAAWNELARVSLDRLGDPARAERAFREALALDAASRDALEGLERIYWGRPAWGELVPILERRVELADPRERVSLLLELADLEDLHLGNPNQALADLTRLLEIDPRHLGAVRRFDAILTRLERWGELVVLLKQQTELKEDPAEQAAAYYRAGRLYLDRLFDQETALAMFREVLRVDPAHVPALKGIEEVALQQQNWTDLVEVLSRQAEVLKDPLALQSLYFKLGETYREFLKDSERSLLWFRKVLDLQPDHFGALRAMEELLVQTESWEGLILVLQKEAEVARDPQEAVSIHFKIGEILRDRLNEPERAALAFRRVLDNDPANLVALQAMEQILSRREEWEGLALVLQKEAELLPDPRQALTLNFRIAEIREWKLGAPERAAEAYRKVLSLEPTFLPAYKSLERIYAAIGRWAELVQLLEREVDVTADPQEVLDLYLRIGETYEVHLDQLERAGRAYDQAVTLAPGSLSALRALCRVHERRGRWEDVVKVRIREMRLLKDPNQLLAADLATAEILEERLGLLDVAATYYQKALEVAPEHLPALRGAERVLERMGRWEDFLGCLEREGTLVEEPAERAQIYYRSGEVLETRLAKIEEALSFYQKALGLVSAHVAARKALERIYLSRGDWKDLISLYEREAALLDRPEERAARLHGVALLWEYKLDDPDRAIEVHQSVLGLVPDHPSTFRCLEHLYLQRQEWARLRDLYRRGAETAGDAPQRAALWIKVAALEEEHLGERESAAASYRKALESDPKSHTALEGIARLLERSEDWEGLLEVFLKAEETFEEGTPRVDLYYRIALLLEERLGRPEKAATVYAKIFESDPADRKAFRALRRLLESRGDAPRLVGLLERALEGAPDLPDAPRLHLEAARLAEEGLGDYALARRHLEAARRGGEVAGALRGLDRVLRTLGAWGDLAEVLDAEADARGDPREAALLEIARGELLGTTLRDDAGATEAFRKALRFDPKSLRALDALALLAEKAGDAVAGADVLAHRAAVTGSPEDHVRLARLQVERLRDPAAGAQSYREALALDPGHLGAVQGLKAIELERGAWESFLELTDREAALLSDPRAQASVIAIKGRILEERLAREDEALLQYDQALALDPLCLDALEPLREILVRREAWPRVVEITRRLLQIEKIPERILAHHVFEGRVLLEHLGDPEQARKAFEEALRLDPFHLPALEAAASIYERAEDWPRLVDAYRRFIELLGKKDPAESYTFHMKLGALFSGPLSNPDSALAEFQRAARVRPREIEPLVRLTELLEAGPGHEAEAVQIHAKILELDPVRMESIQALGRLYERRQEFDRVFCADLTLELLGGLQDLERMFLDSNRDKAPPVPPRPVEEEFFQRLLLHPLGRGPLSEILALLTPHLEDLYPVYLKKYGVERRNRIPSGANHPMRQRLDEVARLLGGVEFDFYEAPLSFPGVILENSTPPSLIMSLSTLKGLDPAEQRFVLARAVAQVKDHQVLARKLPAPEVERLVGAALQIFVPSAAGALRTDEEAVTRLKKTLPRRARKDLEALAERMAEQPPRRLDVVGWMHGMESTTLRAALLFSGGIRGAVRALLKTDPRFRGVDPEHSESVRKAVADSDLLRELLLYALSEPYFTLRGRVGLTILSV